MRSHSWSSVNFNIAIGLRGSVAFVAMGNERQVTNSQRNALAAHLGENPLTGRYNLVVDRAHRVRRLRGRRKAAGGDQADGIRRDPTRVEVGAAPHGRAPLGLHPNTAPRGALR